MNLDAIREILTDSASLQKLVKIETSLTRAIEAELRKQLPKLDALPNAIVPAARDAVYAQTFMMLMAACVNAFENARTNIESSAATEPTDIAAGTSDVDKPLRAKNTAGKHTSRAAVDPEGDDQLSDSRNNADDPSVNELHRKVHDLAAENASLRNENQQLHRKIEKLEEKCSELREIADFEPKWNSAPRDTTLTVKVNCHLYDRALKAAKDWGYDISTYVCRALVLVDADAEPYIGAQIRFSENPSQFHGPQRE